MKIALDCHGADLGPQAAVLGALKALESSPSLRLILCGVPADIQAALADKEYDKPRVEICACGEPVTNNDHPGMAIRRKKDASMFRALELVKSGEADATVSAGNTGALLAGANIILKCVPRVKRATMASVITSLAGAPTLIADMGANVDCEPQRLMAFAIMGVVYMQKIFGEKSPRVALLNNGSEREKGNRLNLATRDLLEASGLNYVGYIEPTELMSGKTDVIVTDGFAGNMAIKSYEGMAKAMMSVIKDGIMNGGIKSKVGYLLFKDVLRQVKHKFSADEVGGAVFLGVDGIVVKTHGSSTADSYCKSILNAQKLAEQDVVKAIADGISGYDGEIG